MWTYQAPLQDMQFILEHVLDAPSSWAQCQSFADLDMATATQVLEEAAKFAHGVLAPLNSVGDVQGCQLEAGAVKTPAGYPTAYRSFVEGGWPALACDPTYGGQGLPNILNAALYEMLAAANHGWTMYPGLLHGAYACLKMHGSEWLRNTYLEKIVSGQWLSTMCLTEPQAGSDLGAVRTLAKPQADGSYRITGNKIFISGGDQDMTPNIVHLVLCRLPDAPAGSKGLSLMLAPKFLEEGLRNSVRCDGLEKKMGIKGSATCVMNFESATGWLVGEPHRGLAAMFVMMNAARLHVGLQGLGHLEMATQNALRYTQERVQMKVAFPKDQSDANRSTAPRPIAQHPGVRRTLWRLRALTEGQRVLAYWTAQLLDDSEQHPDPTRRDHANTLVALLTPVVKAFFTDNGFEGTSQAQQLWGGYGYIHEYGIEQSVRDSRIAMIYEGTNEIQAIDLLQRKVLADGGKGLNLLLAVLNDEVAQCEEQADLRDFAQALQAQIKAIHQATAALLAGQAQDPEWPLRIANDYLRGMGLALMAWSWARTARITAKLPSNEWLQEKRQAAHFGIQWLLPEATQCWHRVMAQGLLLP